MIAPLRGWSNYFCYGTRRSAFRSIDGYAYERVRDFLARRHKVVGRGTRRFSSEVVYGELGLLRRAPAMRCPAACLTVKPVGEPDAVAPRVRFDERRWETGCWPRGPKLPRPSYRSTSRPAARDRGPLLGVKRERSCDVTRIASSTAHDPLSEVQQVICVDADVLNGQVAILSLAVPGEGGGPPFASIRLD
jgi:hypothetical protein